MTPIIEKSKKSNHFDVYYPIKHNDLLSREGITAAVDELSIAWHHFLHLQEKHINERLPYYFWYYFHDGNYFQYNHSTHMQEHEFTYENLNKFWMNVASKNDLISLYKPYLEGVISYFTDGTSKSLWHSDMIAIGEVMTFQLAMANASYIPIYSNLFQYWDMGNEVYQFKEVQSITEKYGVTDQTLDLMRNRCSSRGQHDLSQFLTFLNLAKTNLGNISSNSKLVKLIKDFGTLDWDSEDFEYEDPNWDWTDESPTSSPILNTELRTEILGILDYK